MRNIGEELKAKMVEPSPKALRAIIEACQHKLWQIDSNNKHLIEPSLTPLELELEAYPQDDLESMFPNFKRYYISGGVQLNSRTLPNKKCHSVMTVKPLTLDNILLVCQILHQYPQLQEQAKQCINYLNQQSQFFPWMDEYSIEDGNIIVKPKHNKELREGVANLQNDELDDIVRMFYKHDVSFATKKNAVEDLANQFLEAKREIIQEALGKTQSDALFNFVNNTNIRHNVNKKDKSEENREPTENELQIFFDFGLALVRFADQINKNKNLLDK